ncbi:MAG: hypothetical protein M0Q42_13105 [Xanthomonadales bacterium]|nr:hypothetical protein [Xanthomonadales bacterium]
MKKDRPDPEPGNRNQARVVGRVALIRTGQWRISAGRQHMRDDSGA